MADADDLLTKPGEIAGWPKLKITYRTDPDKITDLLPPGIEPGANPHVHIGIYCVPVLGEPEYGVSTKVEADYDGMPGLYSMGMGIDQEAAIFISRELNGQPKFPCRVRFFRLGDHVEATCTHQGYTFLEVRGTTAGPGVVTPGDVEENEWWIKCSRAVAGVEKSYDFPPHVVRVRSVSEPVAVEDLDADVLFRDSPWDPYTSLLPMREQLSVQLLRAAHKSRDITLEGPLDPVAFWPYADTIGGSRWPGERGGPRRT
ncbi:MAG: acetoacetate decarboxylase family protein [Acidimicrobiia bacterium]|nr:acetoacetate decarboxylase family protein [Acidimicrobiia bacterium]